MSPPSMVSSRLIHRISVLLPEPEGPQSTTTEPSRGRRSSHRAREVPVGFVTSRISIMGKEGEQTRNIGGLERCQANRVV